MLGYSSMSSGKTCSAWQGQPLLSCQQGAGDALIHTFVKEHYMLSVIQHTRKVVLMLSLAAEGREMHTQQFKEVKACLHMILADPRFLLSSQNLTIYSHKTRCFLV